MQKHVVLRTCRGCHKKFPKNALLRIVRQRDKIVLLDETGRASGRGIYLCLRRACLQKVLPKKGRSPLSYFLGVSLPKDFFDTLSAWYERHPETSSKSESGPARGRHA